jgi:conjugative transfer pilus assembly protein TraH
VAERLHRMSDHIATRTPQTAADIGFINNTTEPVYKMLAVANAVPGSNTAETLIETYKDVIALDYAETFLSRAIRQALTALSQTLKRTGIEQEYVETLIETYKDVIALDYAETFLNRAIRQAMSALSQALKRTGIEQQYIDAMTPSRRRSCRCTGMRRVAASL